MQHLSESVKPSFDVGSWAGEAQGLAGEGLEDEEGVCCEDTASPDWLGFSWHKDTQLLLVTRALWTFCSVHVEIVKLPCLQAPAEQVAKVRFLYPLGVCVLNCIFQS